MMKSSSNFENIDGNVPDGVCSTPEGSMPPLPVVSVSPNGRNLINTRAEIAGSNTPLKIHGIVTDEQDASRSVPVPPKIRNIVTSELDSRRSVPVPPKTAFMWYSYSRAKRDDSSKKVGLWRLIPFLYFLKLLHFLTFSVHS